MMNDRLHHAHKKGSLASTARRVQALILVTVLVACAFAGLAWWRKQHMPSAGPAAIGPPPQLMYAPPETEAVDREDMTLDLGEGVAMEFVWIEPLAIWVGKYEVTNREFRRWMPKHNTPDFEGHPMNGARQPVVKVDYRHAVQGYVEWMNAFCGNQLPSGYRVRTLREAEAHELVRCGDDRTYPWGDSWPPPRDWNYHGEESAGTSPPIKGWRDEWAVSCPVDESGRNEWGLHGVGDNVQEWVGKKRGRKGATYDLLGIASWYFGDGDDLRCDRVSRLGNDLGTHYVGFRLVIGR
jgi:formylglycine-generating enzyme required for sulfatase activity